MDYGEELKKRPEFWQRMADEGKGPLANEPEVYPDLAYVWDAFWRLNSSRSVGMGVGGIPFIAIDRYAERYPVDDFEAFHRLLLAMDATYLEHSNAKGEK